MTHTEYQEYLLSDSWREKRIQRIEIDGSRCVFCGKEVRNPTIHHYTYRHIGAEDVWSDICTICDDCHVLVHTGMCRITSKSGRRGWRDTLPAIVCADLKKRGLM